jgi:hypothetical protein
MRVEPVGALESSSAYFPGSYIVHEMWIETLVTTWQSAANVMGLRAGDTVCSESVIAGALPFDVALPGGLTLRNAAGSLMPCPNIES